MNAKHSRTSKAEQKESDRLKDRSQTESALLGSIIIEPTVVDTAEVATVIWNPARWLMFPKIASAVRWLLTEGKPLDLRLLFNKLTELDGADEQSTLGRTVNETPNAAHARHYAIELEEFGKRDDLEKYIATINEGIKGGRRAADVIATAADGLERIKSAGRHIGADVLTIDAMHERFPCLRPILVDGLLRIGETMNIIAATKRGKSWFTLYLAFCIAFGLRLFGRFQCTPGRVLLVDNELHGETLLHRLMTVADAMGVRRDDIGDRIQIITLRGRLTDLHGLQRTLERFPSGYFSAVVLDAKYRLDPAGTDENDNGAQRDVYNLIDHLADRMQASFVLIHHASKGLQSGKSVTDVGSGAGSQSRATDSHVVLREHEEPDAVVMDAALRSFKPLEAVCLRFVFPLWQLADDLDPMRLKPDRPRRAKPPQTEGEKPEPWTAQRYVETFLSGNPRPFPAIAADAFEQHGISQFKSRQLLRFAEAKGSAFRWTGKGNEAHQYATVRQPLLIDEKIGKKGV